MAAPSRVIRDVGSIYRSVQKKYKSANGLWLIVSTAIGITYEN